jgi:hypothetical protein
MQQFGNYLRDYGLGQDIADVLERQSRSLASRQPVKESVNYLAETEGVETEPKLPVGPQMPEPVMGAQAGGMAGQENMLQSQMDEQKRMQIGIKELRDQGVPRQAIEEAMNDYQQIAIKAARAGRPELAVQFASKRLDLLSRMYGAESKHLRDLTKMQRRQMFKEQYRIDRHAERMGELSERYRLMRDLANKKGLLDQSTWKQLNKQHSMAMKEATRLQQRLNQATNVFAEIPDEERDRLLSELTPQWEAAMERARDIESMMDDYMTSGSGEVPRPSKEKPTYESLAEKYGR